MTSTRHSDRARRAWRQLRHTGGQTRVEYGLIIALVAVLAVASLLIFRPAVSSVLSGLSTSV